MRSQRQLNRDVTWYEQRRCWRFKYRDPQTGARRFINCNPGKFEQAGIHLDDPGIVRKQTKRSFALARQLQARFFESLPYAGPQTTEAATPTLTAAIESYFGLFDHHAPSYGRTLRFIFAEFRDVTGDKPFDQIDDGDLKAYERHLTRRNLSRTTIRSYIKQVGMLLHFGLRKGWLRQDPRLTYRLPREELKAPNPLTDVELDAFFSWAWERKPHLA